MNQDKLREEFRKFLEPLYFNDKIQVSPNSDFAKAISNHWLTKMQEREEELIAIFHQNAADKAEKLRELGYGQPPILFEIKEIIDTIRKK